MSTTLRIQINCGEFTCAAKPHEFCPYLRSRKLGTIYYCALWHELDWKGQPQALAENDKGWLLRRAECLKAENPRQWNSG